MYYFTSEYSARQFQKKYGGKIYKSREEILFGNAKEICITFIVDVIGKVKEITKTVNSGYKYQVTRYGA